MPYVMVPVPEEFVPQAIAIVAEMLTRTRQSDWDAESVARLFNEVDERARSVLSIVARAAVAGRDPSDVEVAEAIQLTQRDALAITRGINGSTAAERRPTVISIVDTTETLPNGRVRPKRALVMSPEVAGFVRDAERAEREALPDPLAGLGQ